MGTDELSFWWNEWETYRKKKRKAMTEMTKRYQLRRLEKMGVERAIAAIDWSISQGYTGIWEPPSPAGGERQDTRAEARRKAQRAREC